MCYFLNTLKHYFITTYNNDVATSNKLSTIKGWKFNIYIDFVLLTDSSLQ